MTIKEAAQEMHTVAEACLHSPVWRITPTGFKARCTNPRCKLAMTVDDDNSPTLTHPLTPLPRCPLNSSLN